MGADVSQAGRTSPIIAGILMALFAAGNPPGVSTTRLLSWLIAGLGVWTGAAPFVFADTGNSAWAWSSVLSGVIVAALGVVEATTRPVGRAESWERGAPGPWIAGRYVPGLTFEWEDDPLWLMRDLRERAGRPVIRASRRARRPQPAPRARPAGRDSPGRLTRDRRSRAARTLGA